MSLALVVRALLFGPVAFILIGAGTGVCLAMLYRQDPHDRTRVAIDDSLLLALGGAAAGGVLGCGVMGVHLLWRRLRPCVEVLAVTLLGGAAAAPIGWMIAGGGWENTPREGLLRGAMFGAMVGFLLGIMQIIMECWIAWHPKRYTVNEHSS